MNIRPVCVQHQFCTTMPYNRRDFATMRKSGEETISATKSRSYKPKILSELESNDATVYLSRLAPVDELFPLARQQTERKHKTFATVTSSRTNSDGMLSKYSQFRTCLLNKKCFIIEAATTR